MPRDLLALTWAGFDQAVAQLATLVSPGRSCIYGVPRGGLPLAVALSHTTGLPLVTEPEDGMVCVDDIVDSGRTALALWARFPGAQFLAWLVRDGQGHIAVGAGTAAGQWVVFPWERLENAIADKEAYELSRQ
jgi:xanthine phosphoribosyltransferase